MHRRSFLKGAAALAAAPLLPVAAASAPVPIVSASAPAIAGYRDCLVMFERGMKVFDANGAVRVTLGLWPDDVGGSEADLGQATLVLHQPEGVPKVVIPAGSGAADV